MSVSQAAGSIRSIHTPVHPPTTDPSGVDCVGPLAVRVDSQPCHGSRGGEPVRCQLARLRPLTFRSLWPSAAAQTTRRFLPHVFRALPPSCSSSAAQDKASSPDRASKESSGFELAKLAVFVSGGGSNFKTLHQATLSGRIYGDIVLVISDKPECGGCQYAREHGIPVLPFPRSKSSPEGLSADALLAALRAAAVEFVLLAGFLKLLPPELVAAFPRAVVNIHPALLPAFGGRGFYGMRVHEAVIRSGARFSGPTVHFVDEKYDNGPIIAQHVVPVLPFDTPQDLQARVLAEEHKIYTHVVAALCEGRITWREDGVPLIRKSWDESEFL